ncbi:hypothetical protein BRD17_08960 [Halobacteriales archaeon SW_7_68_16]|nr:MAG: hypothetical protein BRD17_08960 [Halobacteriales archaeon SW_7_68_16]
MIATRLAVAAPLLLVTLLLLGVSRRAWERSSVVGAAWFAILTAGAAVWTGGYAIQIVLPLGPTARLWANRLQWFGVVIVPVAWFVFTIEYAGFDIGTGTVTTLSMISAGALGLVLTSDRHDLIWQSITVRETAGLVTLDETFGLGFYVFLTFAVSLAVIGSAALMSTMRRQGRFDARTLSFVVGIFAPVLAIGLKLASLVPVPGFDLGPIGFGVSALAFGNAVIRHDGLSRTPAARRIGRSALIDSIRDGIVVVDPKGEIVDVNPVTVAALDRSRQSLLGAEAASVLTGVDLDGGVDAGEIEGENGQTFTAQVTPLRDDGRRVGRIVTLRDVTDRRQRDQRLSVLNRILRHNIRNEATVITGYANLIDDPHGEAIASSANDLVSIGEVAREVEALTDDERPTQPIALGSAAQNAAVSVAEEYDEATIDVTVADDAVVADGEVVEVVLGQVIDNAATHVTDPTIEVTVRLTRGDEAPMRRAVVVIEDDGEGIPDRERVPLESGRETPLEHGSGLGLWYVEWAVEQMDGDLRIDVGDGTTVEIHLPIVSATDPVETGVTDRIGAVRSDGSGTGDDSSDEPGVAGDDPATERSPTDPPVDTDS